MHFDLVDLVNNGEFYVMDVEGDGEQHQRPVEISLLRFDRGRPAEEFHWMINPERPISDFVSRMHGITDEMVVNAPTFAEIRNDVASHLYGACVAAHNIGDDIRLLSSVMAEAHLLPLRMIDTIRLARNVVKGMTHYNLDSLSEALDIAVPSSVERSYPIHTDYPGRGIARHSTGVDTYMAGQAMVRMVDQIVPKQVKHVSHSAIYQLGARKEKALRELIEASKEAVPSPWMTPRV